MHDKHVRRDGNDYAQALANLLPRGLAWPREPDSVLMKTVSGLAQIFGYVDSRAGDLLEREVDPRITLEMLPDWERNWGLPDECFPNVHGMDARHKTLVRKMTIEGGQSREFFYNVARDMGYPIHIYEFAPYMAGISQCGDIPDDVNRTRWELGPPEMRFLWMVHAIAESLNWLRCGSGQCGVDPHLFIETLGDIECIFRRWKPAHTQIVWDYEAIDNSYAYDDYFQPGFIPPTEWLSVEGHGRCTVLPVHFDLVVEPPMLNGGLPHASGWYGAVFVDEPALVWKSVCTDHYYRAS